MVPAMDLAVALKGLTITGFNVHKYSDKFDAALSQVCLSKRHKKHTTAKDLIFLIWKVIKISTKNCFSWRNGARMAIWNLTSMSWKDLKTCQKHSLTNSKENLKEKSLSECNVNIEPSLRFNYYLSRRAFQNKQSFVLIQNIMAPCVRHEHASVFFILGQSWFHGKNF